jgi:TetR/AcrR family transcriptional repressor of nem operon
LVTNSAVERGLSCADTANKVGDCLGRIEAAFLRTLQQAQAAGELHTAANARALSRHLTCLLQGLLVVGKVRPEQEALEDMVAIGLSVLG